MLLRAFSTASTDRRVLCSLQKLRQLQGKGLKFPLHSSKPREAAVGKESEKLHRRDLLATGFVFYNEDTQQPRAFVNRCPHAMLELDLDDSDFFCEGFLHCKAHAAFFDPDTGICLKGPTSLRKTLKGLQELNVDIDGENVVLLTEQSNSNSNSASMFDSETLEAYKRMKQQELAKVLAERSNAAEMEEMQERLHEKAMTRMKQYERVS